MRDDYAGAQAGGCADEVDIAGKMWSDMVCYKRPEEVSLEGHWHPSVSRTSRRAVVHEEPLPDILNMKSNADDFLRIS